MVKVLARIRAQKNEGGHSGTLRDEEAWQWQDQYGGVHLLLIQHKQWCLLKGVATGLSSKCPKLHFSGMMLKGMCHILKTTYIKLQWRAALHVTVDQNCSTGAVKSRKSFTN